MLGGLFGQLSFCTGKTHPASFIQSCRALCFRPILCQTRVNAGGPLEAGQVAIWELFMVARSVRESSRHQSMQAPWLHRLKIEVEVGLPMLCSLHCTE